MASKYMDKYFETKIYNFEQKKTDIYYFKIISIRYYKGLPQGFKVQRYEYKNMKTIVIPIDEGIDKKFKLQDEYELRSTDEKPTYYKYNHDHWAFGEIFNDLMRYEDEISDKSAYYYISNGILMRILNDNELTKYIDRQL